MQTSGIDSRLLRLIPLAVIALAAGCAATEGALKEKGAKPLSGDEIRSTFASAGTMKWTNANNVSGTSVFTAPDKFDVAWGTGSANGTIRFTAENYCTTYPTLRNGKEQCFRVYRNGGSELTLFEADSGKYGGRVSLAK